MSTLIKPTALRPGDTIGIDVELDATAGTITFLENGVTI